MECELCGEGTATVYVQIEGAKLHVCSKCARFGKPLATVSVPQSPARKTGSGEKTPQKTPTEIQVIADYGKKLRQLREREGMSVEEFAKHLAETASYIDRVEKERALPSERLAKKIEKLYGLSLFESVTLTRVPLNAPTRDTTTLGDVVRVKRRQGEEESDEDK